MRFAATTKCDNLLRLDNSTADYKAVPYLPNKVYILITLNHTMRR